MSKIEICLNMIVKNESSIIIRLLESVLPIIDNYIICDTGSTDNTPQIITNFFDKHNISGKIIYEPFKNFGYNRTVSINYAKEYIFNNNNNKKQLDKPYNTEQIDNIITYVLLLDADMIFKIEPEFNKQLLHDDAYLIIQKNSSLSYYNTRLIKLNSNSNSNIKCLGPTHEYYDLPQGAITSKLNSIWILDIGDGGCKNDKFERDIRLLKQGIEDEPNNARYYFYLANSYFNTGRHAESIPYYIKRISLGGWNEEIFYAHLNLGHAYKHINNDEMAICTWMNGYNIHSTRSETIYEITKYYREKGQTKIAMLFCILGKNITYPKNDILFIHNDIYETGFDYELSIIGYYNNYPNLDVLSCSLMNKLPDKYNNLLSNYKFYCPKLSQYLTHTTGNIEMTDDINICGTIYKFYGSTPSIFKIGSKYMLNIRFVNYKILHDGTYQFNVNDCKIATVNKMYELDELFNLSITTPPIILLPNNNDLQYIGIEDLKPYTYNNNNNNNIVFIGTIQNPITQKLSIGYGEIDFNNIASNVISNINYTVVNTEWNKDCEKNWVYYGNYNIVYKWYPLTIGKIIKKNTTGNELYLQVQDTITMPEYFKNVRGSTNGVEYCNEIWFICHVVDYTIPRIYYHLFVVFDKDTMKLKKWSNLFTFENAKIEFSLGLIVEDNRVIISYSKWDSMPTISIYNKTQIEQNLLMHSPQ